MNPLPSNTPNPAPVYEFPPLREDVARANNVALIAAYFPQFVHVPLSVRVSISRQMGASILDVEISTQERVEPNQGPEERPTQQRGTGNHSYNLRPLPRRGT